MKRFITVVLVLVLCVGMAGCGGTSQSSSSERSAGNNSSSDSSSKEVKDTDKNSHAENANQDEFEAIVRKWGLTIENDLDSSSFDVKIDVASSDYSDENELATDVLMTLAQVFSDTLDLFDEETLSGIPCKSIYAEICVDGRSIGNMNIYTATDKGLLGTNPPKIISFQYDTAFDDAYNELLLPIDSEHYNESKNKLDDFKKLLDEKATAKDEDFNNALLEFGFKVEEISESGTSCTLGLYVNSSDYDDADELAMNCLYAVSKLFLDCMEMEECPYGSIGIKFYVDDSSIGTMSIYTAFSIGLMGANNPIIVNETYRDSFDKMYSEYMSDIDSSKLSSKE